MFHYLIQYYEHKLLSNCFSVNGYIYLGGIGISITDSFLVWCNCFT